MRHATAAHAIAFARYGIDLSEDASLRYAPRAPRSTAGRVSTLRLATLLALALAAAVARLLTA